MKIEQNYSLQPHNSFGLNVKSDYFSQVNDEYELIELLEHCQTEKLNFMILGGGSNVLFTSDFSGMVIKNAIKGIEILKENESHLWLKVGGGENWHEFVMHCVQNNWGGVENLSLIPGTVGAAPMQNIGAYGVEIEQIFDHLEAIDIESKSKRKFTREDCNFGYRESIFKKELKGKYVITSVCLRLSKNPEFNTSYGDIENTLNARGIKKLTIKDVSDAVISIRQSKLPDPVEIGNSGSFFKNPIINTASFNNLKAAFPEIPFYEAGENQFKIPAAWLIDQSGWKGKRFGNIGVHQKQALVLVNYGGGNGLDIKKLAERIQTSVKEKFNIELHPEVNII